MRKPIIGITPSLINDEKTISLHRSFQEILTGLGAVAVILPITDDPDVHESIAEQIDGVIFSGGGDIDGMYFGEETRPVCGAITPERDAAEIPLAKLLYEKKKPVLGICRGMQVMNVALGGTLYQDIESDHDAPCIAHRQKQLIDWPSHQVSIAADSMLAHFLDCETLRVNSSHHQAVKQAAPGLTINAVASDGIIEGFEATDGRFYLGLQWHPERTTKRDKESTMVFRAFVDAVCAQMTE